MSKFSPEQRAEIFRRSRQLLEDKPKLPPERAAPAREVPLPEPADPIREWAEWHDACDREREAARAELRRQERDNARTTRTRQDLELEARVAALEERVSAIEESLGGVDQLASASASFSDAASARLNALEALIARLDRTLEAARAASDREVGALRDRLAAAESAHAREAAFTGKQLAAARGEIDALTGGLEQKRDRERLAADLEIMNNNVVELHRQITERGGAA